GGYTQSQYPYISEAQGMQNVFSDLKAWPPLDRKKIYLDDQALDSPENVILGLLTAREKLGPLPIRRVGALVAWKFKKARFDAIAKELRIHQQFYFHGVVSHAEAAAGDRALQGEIAQMEEIRREPTDYLQLSEKWETKRKARYQGPDYDSRLN